MGNVQERPAKLVRLQQAQLTKTASPRSLRLPRPGLHLAGRGTLVFPMSILIGSGAGLIASKIVGQAYSPGDPPGGDPDGYSAHWLFNDGSGTNVNDSGPNNFDGTIVGTGHSWGSGYLEFDGTAANYVDIGTDFDLDDHSFEFSVTLTDPVPPGSDYTAIFVTGLSGAGYPPGFNVLLGSNGRVYAHVIDSTGSTNYKAVESTTNVSSGTYTIKVVVDRPNDLLKILVDEVEEDSADITGLLSLSSPGVNSAFAYSPNGTPYNRQFTGRILDAQVSAI